MKSVSFQGERGAYSEVASRNFFNEKIKTVPCVTFSDALDSTVRDDTEFTVLPVENSIEGSVGESYDLLYLTPLNAIGEHYLRIEHCLIGNGKLEDVDTVYSHPQALGQCRNFLELHKIKTVPTYDTAGSVKIIKDIGTKEVACIASKMASEIHNMPIISEEIANNPNNYTRFLVLSKNKAKETGRDKTSIIFSIKHEPGSLYKIIKNFHDHNVNLTKIESRPNKKNTWEYNFYVDFEGHEEDSKVSTMIEHIKKETLFMKILGSYPAVKLG